MIQALAKHVMSVHGSGPPVQAVEGELDIATMRSYISYCKV
jgi:hypothetical protein